ncbi:lipase family alpha/beta hydrolase [Streptomyces xanthophaeus]|uniref:lipase family alpha/beta hydrolase n=1 Tax=Streptomyces xanthophaeus TaxID=67385 RepID=UPI0004CDC0AB|nr:hypothetical protein [Streptomyces xanthophaeus]
MRHDLVVYVPGILGSRLTRGDQDVWHQSLRTALHLAKELATHPRSPGAAFDRLALPPGIGDNRPEAPWAVAADGLVKTPSALPGLLSSLGYPDLRALVGDLHEEQYLAFTYDWRLSNRLTAADLGTAVGRALTRWRERVRAYYPQAADEPKVIFLCHSMGGLVTRYYLECLGGRETARSLVTLGTPHRGAAKAVRFLTRNGIGPGDDQRLLGRKALTLAGTWLNPALAELCRSFPSVGQLLPVYRAVMLPGLTRTRYLDDEGISVPDLPSELVKDAFAFHTEFEDALARNRRRSGEGGLPYKVHCLGGRAHPTVHGVLLAPEGLKFPTALDEVEPWTGDGTVPEESAFAGWALEEMSDAVWSGHRHVDLTGADTVGHQLASVVRGRGAGQTLTGEEQFGVLAPDFAVAGEPFEVLVEGAQAGRPVRASLSAAGAAQPAGEPVALTPDGEGLLRAALTAGAAGTWVLRLEAEGPYAVHREVLTVVDG